MPTHVAADPNWAAGDLLEHARTLTALASAPAGPHRTEHDLVLGVRELHARCVRLEIDPIVGDVPARRRGRLSEALDRLVGAADDLAAIVLLRCTDGGALPDGDGPDLVALLARVTERHDHVVVLLGRAGVRRTAPTG
jgi:hypothetical protein